MKSTFILNFVSAVILSVSIVHGDVIAFSGSTCDGGEGSNVPCQEQCIHASGRHSALTPLLRFIVQVVADGPHCLTFYEDGGCSINVGEVVNPGGASCTNINTGTDVNSFKCSPNGVCAN
ncbi:hypothetical protein Clacol_007245 [Clathrus columnatus]|uniref:Uncharacterized protein n=1 Tax=Clathrus columnatus TaxID=1419009 RepID=A0AAV5AKM3_9AGAM|nr:hypothetical protein Clacol_007245 [Clathrus columnatus]